MADGLIPVFGTGGIMRHANDYLHDGKTVFIGRKGTINKPFFFEGKFWTVDTLFYTNQFKEVSPEFVYLVFAGINWLKYNEASGLPSLSKNTIGQIPIVIPGENEQQKIADFLGSVDAWLDNLRGQKTALQSYKQGMMQKLFSGQVRFKDEAGKSFPDWITSNLDSLGEVKTSSVDKLSSTDERPVKLLNYMDVYRRDHVYNADIFQDVTANDREISTFNLRQGDILFTPSSETPIDIGHSAVVMEDLDEVLYSYHLVRFRPKENVFIGRFAGYAFKSYLFYKEFWRRAQGATRYTLSLESIKDASVTYPPSLAEQQKIADFLTALDQTITAKADEITKVEEWKKGLMQKMFV